jgi:hypothetical protein
VVRVLLVVVVGCVVRALLIVVMCCVVRVLLVVVLCCVVYSTQSLWHPQFAVCEAPRRITMLTVMVRSGVWRDRKLFVKAACCQERGTRKPLEI